jgi:hypothetical protein
VLATSEDCLRQALHWKTLRAPTRRTQWAASPQCGQRKPYGQRALQSRFVLGLGPELAEEIRHRQAGLELDRIHRHGTLS